MSQQFKGFVKHKFYQTDSDYVKLISLKVDMFGLSSVRYVDVDGGVKTKYVNIKDATNLNIHSMHFHGSIVKFCLKSNSSKMITGRISDFSLGTTLGQIFSDIRVKAKRWDQLNKFEKLVHNVGAISDVDKLLTDLDFDMLFFTVSNFSKKRGVQIHNPWEDTNYIGKLVHLLLKLDYLEYDRSRPVTIFKYNKAKCFKLHHIFKRIKE